MSMHVVACACVAAIVLPMSHRTPSRCTRPRLVASSSVGADIDSASTSWASSLGDDIHGVAEAAAYHAIFSSLATSEEFLMETWARKPLLLPDVPGIAHSFTMDHLAAAVDDDFLDAGRGIPDEGSGSGWKMAAVSEPRGSSFEDAKMRFVDVENALRLGTVVFNSAGAHIPRLGTLCLAALDAFGLPNCLNLYVTAKGTPTSAPPHTDKQDVFVLQSTGAKRWRVYEPPPPARRPTADPLARGKAADGLRLDELGPPLLDVVLGPGAVLYVPAGFPHTTDTVHTAAAGADADADSVHLTIGLDTHIWGLDYLSMSAGALDRAALAETSVRETTLAAEAYWRLMAVPRSLGFLRRFHGHDGARDAVAAELAECARLVEPSRWAGASMTDVAAALDAAAVAEQAERHAERLVTVQRAMYLDAAKDVRPSAPGAPRVSVFRVREHMSKIEAAMEEHLSWYGPRAVARATAAATAAAAAPAPARPAKTKAAATTTSGGGMGVGRGMGVAGGGGGRGAKAKAKKKKKR